MMGITTGTLVVIRPSWYVSPSKCFKRMVCNSFVSFLQTELSRRESRMWKTLRYVVKISEFEKITHVFPCISPPGFSTIPSLQ